MLIGCYCRKWLHTPHWNCEHIHHCSKVDTNAEDIHLGEDKNLYDYLHSNLICLDVLVSKEANVEYQVILSG